MSTFFSRYFENLALLVATAPEDDLEGLVDLLRRVGERRGKVLLAGNGGSAAIVNHVTVDLVKAAGLRAVNFNESSLITCFANDYGFDRWVVEALRAHADPEDLVVLISSSGESDDIVNAAMEVEKMGLDLVVLSGFSSDNRLRSYGQISFWVDSTSYNHVENTHQVWLLAALDRFIASSKSDVVED